MMVLKEQIGMTKSYRESIITELEAVTGEKVVIIPYGLNITVGIVSSETSKFKKWINKLLGYKDPKVVINDVITNHRVEVISINVK